MAPKRIQHIPSTYCPSHVSWWRRDPNFVAGGLCLVIVSTPQQPICTYVMQTSLSTAYGAAPTTSMVVWWGFLSFLPLGLQLIRSLVQTSLPSTYAAGPTTSVAFWLGFLPLFSPFSHFSTTPLLCRHHNRQPLRLDVQQVVTGARPSLHILQKLRQHHKRAIFKQRVPQGNPPQQPPLPPDAHRGSRSRPCEYKRVWRGSH